MSKHYIGDIIKVYDGDLIGWTTAELIEKVGECNGLERWRMQTKEGYELRRLIDVQEQYKPKYLMQPIKFRRKRNAKWESGTKYTYAQPNEGDKIMDADGNIVEKVFKYEVDWGI